MNIWNLLMKEGAEDTRPQGYYLNVVKNKKNVGMGSQWDNDKGQPDSFKNNVKIDDYVVVRCANDTGTLILVQVKSEAHNDTNHGEWFDLYRGVDIVAEATEEDKKNFREEPNKGWSDGFYAPTTFQSGENWPFAKWWVKKMMKEKQMEKYVKLLKNTKNLILTGAPGTGKTYLARNIAAKIMFNSASYKDLSEEQQQMVGYVQFHSSYDYTDFVEGLRPVSNTEGGTDNIGFKRQDGILRSFAERPLQASKVIILMKHGIHS